VWSHDVRPESLGELIHAAVRPAIEIAVDGQVRFEPQELKPLEQASTTLP
jgi:hypothetical protein